MERIDEDVKELAKSISAGVIAPVDTPVEEPKEDEDPSLTRQALGFVPGVGTALDVADVAKDVERGDYVGAGIGAAVTALGLIPGAGRLAGNALKAATKAFRKTDASDAQKLIDDPKLLEEWKAKQSPAPQKNLPVTEKAAEDLYQGDITSKEFREIVKKELPITSMYTQENFPDMPTVTDIAGALGKNASKGVLGVKGFDIPQGKIVGARLDIPAYNRYNKWVVSIHDGDEDLGLVMGYGQAIKLKDVRFSSKPGTALDIARRKVTKQKKVDPDTGKVIKPEQRMPKSTIARAIGKYQKEDPYKLQQEAYNLINDPEWTQVGMNPYRASYFYDKATGKPVFNAKEVIQIGPLVLAKGIKKPKLSEMKKFFKTTPARTKDGRILAMNKGGDIMEQQMEMAFMNEGGVLKDDGMRKDPVSGNDVPSGSMAKEVRDDIPAQLSEGEYVVPADVVRFHGVEKFEDLRRQAKKGFGDMERDGRIGGEPVDDSFPIPLDQLQTYNEGGDTEGSYEEVFGKPYTPGQRYGTEFAPTGTGFELVTYTSPDGKRTIVIPHYNGKPMSRVPSGFTPGRGGGTGGGGAFDPQAGETDRSERENEEVRRRNLEFMESSKGLFPEKTKPEDITPKAPEDFTGQDYLDYYNQTKGFGADDILRNIPIIGGLLSVQDQNIRNGAESMLKRSSRDLTESQFNAAKALVVEAPQQSFLGKLFGGTSAAFTPDAYVKDLTYKQYVEGAKTGGKDYVRLPPSTPFGDTAPSDTTPSATKQLTGQQVSNYINNISQGYPLQGGVMNTVTNFMLGIRKDKDGNPVVSTPEGPNTPLTQEILDRIEKNRVKVQNEAMGKDTDVSNVTANTSSSTQPVQSGPTEGSDDEDRPEPDAQNYGDLSGSPFDNTGPSTSTTTYTPPSYSQLTGSPFDNTGPSTSYGTDAGFGYGGSDVMTPFNKGGLASKSKAKPKTKKRTTKKGLGVKTKAT